MTDTDGQSARSERAPDIGVEARDNIEVTQLADRDPFHLWHGHNQDVGAFVGREFHCGSGKGAAIPAPVPGSNVDEIEEH
jgi:hypothetical protein